MEVAPIGNFVESTTHNLTNRFITCFLRKNMLTGNQVTDKKVILAVCAALAKEACLPGARPDSPFAPLPVALALVFLPLIPAAKRA